MNQNFQIQNQLYQINNAQQQRDIENVTFSDIIQDSGDHLSTINYIDDQQNYQNHNIIQSNHNLLNNNMNNSNAYNNNANGNKGINNQFLKSPQNRQQENRLGGLPIIPNTSINQYHQTFPSKLNNNIHLSQRQELYSNPNQLYYNSLLQQQQQTQQNQQQIAQPTTTMPRYIIKQEYSNDINNESNGSNQDQYNNQITNSQIVLKQLQLKPAQYELYKNLKEMGINSEIAYFILVSEKCMNIDEAVSFLTTDETNLYNHIFLPTIQPDVCEICNASKRLHSKNTIETIKKGQQIREHIKQLVQSNTLENHDMIEIIRLSQHSLDNSPVNQNNNNNQIRLNNQYKNDNGHSSPIEDNNIKQQQKKRLIMCQICLSLIDESSMLYFNGQNHEICLECFKMYLTEQIKISNVENLQCPHCWQTLTEQIIMDHTTQTMHKKYKYFLRNALINKDPLKRFCPTPNCTQVIELSSKTQSKATCLSCNVVICCLCNRTDHANISCNELMEKEIEDLTNSRDIQRCKQCKSLVQKVQGCNHMTCSICYYQWCWLCGDTYTRIHMAPLNPFGCPFLQSERFTVSNTQMWKIYILRFLTLILILLLLPFAIIFSGPVIALMIYFKFLNQIQLHQRGIFIKIIASFFGLIAFLLGFLLDPLIIIAVIPFFIFLIYTQYQEKIKVEMQSNQRLEELARRNHDVLNL